MRILLDAGAGVNLDEAIRQLEEMRRQVGGHVPVKFRRVYGLDDEKRSDHDVTFEIETWGQGIADGGRYSPARVVRIYGDRS
jgi:hypothetical protein